MGDVVDELIEVDVEGATRAEAAGDVSERGFGRAPRQWANLAIPV